MNLAKYVAKRILLAIVTVFIVCAITFFSMNAIPGGPFEGEKALSPEIKATLMERYNLDKPVGEQFVLYLKNLLHGDFGVSLKTGRDIGTTIFDSFKISARLGGMAALVALIAGLVFGSTGRTVYSSFSQRSPLRFRASCLLHFCCLYFAFSWPGCRCGVRRIRIMCCRSSHCRFTRWRTSPV